MSSCFCKYPKIDQYCSITQIYMVFKVSAIKKKYDQINNKIELIQYYWQRNHQLFVTWIQIVSFTMEL